MRTCKILAAIFAIGILIGTGCSSTYKTGSSTRTVSVFK
jgi:hypothetical protein